MPICRTYKSRYSYFNLQVNPAAIPSLYNFLVCVKKKEQPPYDETNLATRLTIFPSNYAAHLLLNFDLEKAASIFEGGSAKLIEAIDYTLRQMIEIKFKLTSQPFIAKEKAYQDIYTQLEKIADMMQTIAPEINRDPSNIPPLQNFLEIVCQIVKNSNINILKNFVIFYLSFLSLRNMDLFFVDPIKDKWYKTFYNISPDNEYIKTELIVFFLKFLYQIKKEFKIYKKVPMEQINIAINKVVGAQDIIEKIKDKKKPRGIYLLQQEEDFIFNFVVVEKNKKRYKVDPITVLLFGPKIREFQNSIFITKLIWFMTIIVNSVFHYYLKDKKIYVNKYVKKTNKNEYFFFIQGLKHENIYSSIEITCSLNGKIDWKKSKPKYLFRPLYPWHKVELKDVVKRISEKYGDVDFEFKRGEREEIIQGAQIIQEFNGLRHFEQMILKNLEKKIDIIISNDKVRFIISSFQIFTDLASFIDYPIKSINVLRYLYEMYKLRDLTNELKPMILY